MHTWPSFLCGTFWFSSINIPQSEHFVIARNRGVCLFFNLHFKKKFKTGQIFKYYFLFLLRKTLVLRENIVPFFPLLHHHQHNSNNTKTSTISWCCGLQFSSTHFTQIINNFICFVWCYMRPTIIIYQCIEKNAAQTLEKVREENLQRCFLSCLQPWLSVLGANVSHTALSTASYLLAPLHFLPHSISHSWDSIWA